MNDLFRINAARISSCYSNIDLIKSEENDLEKGGEGTRGGHVIGHTKSGKPVYEHTEAQDYHDFSGHDHADAADLHEKKALFHSKESEKTGGFGAGMLHNHKKHNHNSKAEGHIKKHSEYMNSNGTHDIEVI